MKKPDETKPPVFFYLILKILIRRDMQKYMLGDLDEEYLEIVEASGISQAKKWYRRHCLRSIPNIIKDTVVWKLVMFRNYIIVALRNMKRQKVFSLINILGLSLALMVCLWIYLFVADEVSFDRFHENSDAIYSVVKTDHHFQHMRRFIEAIAGPALKEYFPGVEYSVRFANYDAVVTHENRLFQERCNFVDRDFFKMFSYNLVHGESDHVLASASTVVLAESLAEK